MGSRSCLQASFGSFLLMRIKNFPFVWTQKVQWWGRFIAKMLLESFIFSSSKHERQRAKLPFRFSHICVGCLRPISHVKFPRITGNCNLYNWHFSNKRFESLSKEVTFSVLNWNHARKAIVSFYSQTMNTFHISATHVELCLFKFPFWCAQPYIKKLPRGFLFHKRGLVDYCGYYRMSFELTKRFCIYV